MTKQQKIEPIEKVQTKLEGLLLKHPEISGIGIGEERGSPVILVYVVKESPSSKKIIPSEFGGYKVKTVVSGSMTAL